MVDPRGSHCTDMGWGRAGGQPADSGGGGRSGWHFRGADTGESEAPSGLDKGIKAGGGLDRTSGDDGERRGGSSISRASSQSIRSHSISSSPRCVSSSPSAAVQGAELHSVLTPSTACSLVMGTVAGSRTWSDGLGSISEVILCSVARRCRRWWAGL